MRRSTDTKAANGVITIKTKRGANQEGVKFNVRSEYGFSDMNSINYGAAGQSHAAARRNGHALLRRRHGEHAACSQTVDWMQEILRINNVNADTIRTPRSDSVQQLSGADGTLQNVFQAQIWPGQYYNTFAADRDARSDSSSTRSTRRARSAATRFYVSGSYTDNHGAIKQLTGQQEQRARVNLDYDVRSNLLISVSTLYDKATTDTHGGAFGTLLRGAPAGTDYLARRHAGP